MGAYDLGADIGAYDFISDENLRVMKEQREAAMEENKLLEAGLVKRDISREEWREYVMPHSDGKFVTLKITSPVTLYVKRGEKGDSHRVVSEDGITHYIPAGWVSIRWKSNPEVEF